MIYLTVRLARNSAKAVSGLSWEAEFEQTWLHPSSHSDEASQNRWLDEQLDRGNVQWFRSPRVAYVLRTP